MISKWLLVHSLFLFALPVIVAYYGVTTAGAAGLVLLALFWRWAVTLFGVLFPVKVPDLQLDTLSISHFSEKVRWCMDRLGVDYHESPSAGVIGVMFTGRTVPRLRVRTGRVCSSLGNSAEILRYLWGRYACERGSQADFLEPFAERVELEKRIDRYGAHLQVWVYYHILDDRGLALHVWGRDDGAVPRWQRLLLPVLFPVTRVFLRKAFRISDDHYEKTVTQIEVLLEDIESRLTDGRRSILGSDAADYVDYSFAAMSALWLQPPEFAAGRARAVRIDRERYPAGMKSDVERWAERCPLAVSFVERLYREERASG